MKTFLVALLAAACLVAYVHGYPGSLDSSSSSSSSSSSKSSHSSSSSSSSSSSESDEKKLDMLLVWPDSGRQFARPFLEVDDRSDIDDSFEGFLPSWWPSLRPSYKSIYDTLENMQKFMERFRERMSGMMPSWTKIPEGANTTSTTKIIDGHIVTINETTYTDGDDEHSTLFRVRVIDVKPQNETVALTESETEAEATTVPTSVTGLESTTQSRSVETVEEFDNEIPKNQVETLTA